MALGSHDGAKSGVASKGSLRRPLPKRDSLMSGKEEPTDWAIRYLVGLKGHTAALSGKKVSSNPYERGTAEWASWIEGWVRGFRGDVWNGSNGRISESTKDIGFSSNRCQPLRVVAGRQKMME